MLEHISSPHCFKGIMQSYAEVDSWEDMPQEIKAAHWKGRKSFLLNLINPHIILDRSLGHYIFFLGALLCPALTRGNKSVN